MKVVDDLDFECADAATYLTYRDSKTVIEALTKAEVSKHRIHSYVQRHAHRQGTSTRMRREGELAVR